jgi:hypothetical protein
MVVILCQQRHQQSTKIAHWVEQVTYKLAIVKRPPLFQIPVFAFSAFAIIPHWQ